MNVLKTGRSTRARWIEHLISHTLTRTLKTHTHVCQKRSSLPLSQFTHELNINLYRDGWTVSERSLVG